MGNKTTLIQIAKAAGVSISTVDRVLNDRGGVSSKSEELVVEWASKLNLDRIAFRKHLRTLRIAVMMQPPENPFFRDLRGTFIDVNSGLEDLNIRCFLHYVSVADVAATSRKIGLIKRDYDAMIVVCPEVPSLTAELKKISHKMPIVTLVTDLPGCGRLAYVGSNNRQSGRAAGELMGRFLGPEGGNVLIVSGTRRYLGQEEREMGFRSVLKERFAIINIAGSLESEEDQMRAGRVVSDAMQAHPDIRGIYNMSSGNSAILKVTKAQALNHRIVLITHELTAERRRMLQEGDLDAVIDQNPVLEARTALDILAQHFGRQKPEVRPKFIPFNIFIRENV